MVGSEVHYLHQRLDHTVTTGSSGFGGLFAIRSCRLEGPHLIPGRSPVSIGDPVLVWCTRLSLDSLSLSNTTTTTRKSHHSVNFSAKLGPSGHVLGSQRPQYIKSDAKKVWYAPQVGDLTVQRACAKSRMALTNRFER